MKSFTEFRKVNEDIDKTIARHESGIRKANAAMKTASGNQQMVKHMNALTHHKKALKTAMMRQSMQEEGIKSGHKRPTEDGAGLTQKGVDAHRRENPGSKLQTAVTTPPSKLKAGSKAAGRRKSFCARSKSWTGERGKAARRRWNC
jgi:predicted  nucleic acid-binding Zn-ribbon protein